MKSAHLAWSCRLFHAAVTAVLVLTALGHSVASAAERVSIGSKSFTESVVLGEILQQLAGDAGAQADHLRQMGELTGGPAPMDKKSRSRFLSKLDEIVNALG